MLLSSHCVRVSEWDREEEKRGRRGEGRKEKKMRGGEWSGAEERRGRRGEASDTGVERNLLIVPAAIIYY